MASEKKSGWKKTRKFFNDVHLWLGLGSGLIVIFICFSGTIYVYNTELREMSLSELYTLQSTPDAEPLSAEIIIDRVEKSAGGKATIVKIPADKNRLWQVSIKKEENPQSMVDPKRNGKNETPKTSGSASKPSPNTVYSVNQYTGDIVGDLSNTKTSTTELMRTMFSLHRWLMLDRVEEPIFGELPNKKLGSYITGSATILFTIGVLTGLVIWFPQKLKNWKQGLKVKWNANFKRVNHDLHNTFAFYSMIFLFLMGITGPQWSFPWYREGLQKTLGAYHPPDEPRPEPPKSIVPLSGDFQKLSLKEYIAVAGRTLDYAGDYSINLPTDSTSVVTINKTRTGFFAPSAGDKLMLDQYTADLAAVEIFRDKPFNERIAGSIKALHLGDVYGKFSKLLYFFACLVATSLPITGTIIWLNKLKKKRAKKESKAAIALKGQQVHPVGSR